MSPSSVIIKMVKPVENITKLYLSIPILPGSGEIRNTRCLYAAATGGGGRALYAVTQCILTSSTLDLATGAGGGGGGRGGECPPLVHFLPPNI
jgi:hypothetical protein